MEADRGEDLVVRLGQRDGRAARLQVGADGHAVFDAGGPCAREYVVDLGQQRGVMEVCVGVEQRAHVPSLLSSSSTIDLSSLRNSGPGGWIGVPGRSA